MRAADKLAIMDAATELTDLITPASNRLELLKGDRDGQHSIRINQQWRICFIWNIQSKRCEDVEIVDYH